MNHSQSPMNEESKLLDTFEKHIVTAVAHKCTRHLDNSNFLDVNYDTASLLIFRQLLHPLAITPSTPTCPIWMVTMVKYSHQ